MKLQVHQVAQRMNISPNTVATRFRSKYSKERWGVRLDSKTRHRFVYERDLNLWKEPVGLYRGRPISKLS